MKSALKLSLNKETIANLNNDSMTNLVGGAKCSLGDCPASLNNTYCPGGGNTDCNSACGTSCVETACYTWCDCQSIATGTCC
jgi:natural product precursor